MIKVGIDAISFYTSHYYLDLADLAEKRGVDVDKFNLGLGQYKMSMPPPDEDIVSMGANVGYRVLQQVDPNDIDTILFATESSFDLSKSAGIYIHHLLGLSRHCRSLELKQACYGTTGGLQLALGLVTRFPKKKVLLIASDISRYALNSPGESSQGCGAVAMIISANPRLMTIEPEYGVYTDDVMDFFRPNYCDAAIVEGKYSSLVYLRALESAWKQYQESSKRKWGDIDFHCYHSALPRLVEKAQKLLEKINGISDLSEEKIKEELKEALHYGRMTGNSYTAALYISLASLLDNKKSDLTGKRIGFYSYGSGCVAEYFSGVVEKEYRSVCDTEFHQTMMKSRKRLAFSDYEDFYNFHLTEKGDEQIIPKYETGLFRLKGIKDHKRIYEKVE